MGSGQSKDQHKSQELLNKLCSSQSIPFPDDYWETLGSAFQDPLISLDPQAVQDKLDSFCEQLLVCNPLSKNFQMLVLYAVMLLSDQHANDQTGRVRAANVLRLITTVIKVAAETGNGSSLLDSLFEVTPSLPIPQEHVAPGDHVLLRLLVRRCLLAILRQPPRGGGYLLLMECVHLLLMLLAITQLGTPHVRGPPGSHPGVEALCSMTHMAPQVLVRLLTLYITRPQPPEEVLELSQPRGVVAASGEGTTLGAVASAATTLMWLPATTLSGVLSAVMSVGGGGAAAQDPDDSAQPPAHTGGLSPGFPLAPSPLADLAVLLLLLLLHAPDQAPAYNPYLWALRELQDAPGRLTEAAPAQGNTGHGDVEGAQSTSTDPLLPRYSSSSLPTTTPAVAALPMADLVEALSRALRAPSAVGPAPGSGSGQQHTPAKGAAHTVIPAGPSTAQDTPHPSVGTGSSLPVPAWRLGGSLVSSGSEEALGLLYMLLTQSPVFKEYLTSHPDMPRLLLPLLRVLYISPAPQQPHLVFLAQTLLLVLSQDDLWARQIHRHTLGTPRIAWCKESVSNATFGSLVVIVLLKTISTCWSLAASSDLTSPANALAALANLAPYCTHLHARAAQRLVTLLSSLAKKYKRMGGELGGPLPLSAALSGETATQTGASASAQLTMVEEYLRLTLEIINLCVTGPAPMVDSDTSGGGTEYTSATAAQLGVEVTRGPGHLASNVELVYALLHQQECVASLRTHPRLGALADNLCLVIEFFNEHLSKTPSKAHSRPSKDAPLLPLHHPAASQDSPQDTPQPSASASGFHTTGQVLSILSQAVHQWRPERVKMFPQLRFVFREEEEPDAFFVPYVWRLVLQRCGSLTWETLMQVVMTGPQQDGGQE